MRHIIIQIDLAGDLVLPLLCTDFYIGIKINFINNNSGINEETEIT